MQHIPLFVLAPRMILVKNRQALLDRLQEAVDLGHGDIVLGFWETEYVDSSGLKMLVGFQHTLVRTLGGRLRILGLNDELRALFVATRLDRVFELVDAVDDQPDAWTVLEPALAGAADDAGRAW